MANCEIQNSLWKSLESWKYKLNDTINCNHNKWTLTTVDWHWLCYQASPRMASSDWASSGRGGAGSSGFP